LLQPLFGFDIVCVQLVDFCSKCSECFSQFLFHVDSCLWIEK